MNYVEEWRCFRVAKKKKRLLKPRYRFYRDSFGGGRLLENPHGEWIKYEEDVYNEKEKEITKAEHCDEEVGRTCAESKT
jgi:hypothetical protein